MAPQLADSGRPVTPSSPVLVVDDDAMLARTLADVLEMHGFDARTASDGQSAIAMARELRPSVAVVDLRLPDMDGLDLASLLHADAQEMQIIILTGNASVETAVRALRDENCEYLIKPIEPSTLVRTMRAADDRRKLRSTEDELRRTQSLARAVFDASPLPVVVGNGEGQITLWNPAATRLFGWTAEEAMALGNPLWTEDVVAETKERLLEVMAGETFVGIHVKRKNKDGRILDLRQTLAPIYAADGSPEAILAVFEDITERRRLDQELRDAQRLDQVGRLAGGVAHDFNNLLAVIIAESELALGENYLAPEARQGFTDILSAAKAGSDLTRQLLSFARKRPVEPIEVDINTLVMDVEHMFRRVIGERVSYTADLSPDAGATFADKSQLEQVVVNLLVNARDAMSQGGRLTVSTRRHLEPAGGRPALERREWIVLSVSDTGHGIPAALRDRIFEPFFTTKPRGQGTGLGLATTYGIVQQCGGLITVDSVEGEGSTFTIYLPRSGSKTTPLSEVPTAPSAKGQGVVVVVEDQSALRAVARRVLERKGYVVHTCESGEDAARLLASLVRPPDAMVIDINLPDGDGRDIASAVRAKHPSVATILTSGAPETMRQLGDQVQLLEKPYSVETLSAAVAAGIEQARTHRFERM
jgi:two-component system cell cycle sensor histidine kinase/response regulator CckA